jgi:hypothetical protein
MANAGHISGRNCSVRFWDTTGASHALTPRGNSTDINYTADDQETTAYGDNTHTNLSGLRNYGITFSGWWAGSGDASAASLLFELIGACAGTMVQVNPAGSKAGSMAYAACVNLSSQDMSFPVDNIATMSWTATPRAGSLSACADSVW